MTLRSGERVLIRPVRPDDKQRLLDAFDRLSPESRYRRFFAATPRLPAAQLRYFTEVDHHAHEALGAVDPRTGEGLGVARFIKSRDVRAPGSIEPPGAREAVVDLLLESAIDERTLRRLAQEIAATTRRMNALTSCCRVWSASATASRSSQQ